MVEQITEERYRGYYIRSRFMKTEFVIWAGKQPLTGDSPMSEPLYQTIYFNFGKTQEEATANMHSEIDGMENSKGYIL